LVKIVIKENIEVIFAFNDLSDDVYDELKVLRIRRTENLCSRVFSNIYILEIER
jgi:hypothetical protein